jgi:hypothetical protein
MRVCFDRQEAKKFSAIYQEKKRMFTDAIRTADNEHEIYFLLTSYADAVRYERPAGTVPESITRLPVTGADDVKERLNQLVPALDAASKRLDDKTVALIKQALHTYGTALGRLQSLNKEKSWTSTNPQIPPRRVAH